MSAGEDDPWETHARWWQERHSHGADPEYEEQILPMASEHLSGARRVLDVGAGEGQVARLAAREGAEVVVGIDRAWALTALAAQRAGGPAYARATAAALPFPAASFDAVVACGVLEHVRELDEAVAEIARVLAPGGRFLAFLNHPLLQAPSSGWIDDQVLDPPEQYWRIGSYLVEECSVEEVEANVFIPLIHRPLSRYVNTLVDAGLLLTRMVEPPPPPGFCARAWEYEAAASIPRLLFLRSEKPARSFEIPRLASGADERVRRHHGALGGWEVPGG